MFRELKVLALAYGIVFVLVGIGMWIAEPLIGWHPSETQVIIRAGLSILGLIGLAFSGS